jgi:putative phage-type endonuclease
MSARAMWLEGRRRGIGGSDAAAILGFDPWRSGLDVWISKTQKPKDDRGDEFLLRLGKLLEPVIAGLYETETGRRLSILDPEIIEHAQYPELIGTPDRICYRDGRVVELKSEHQFADKFGDPGSDEVPDHYAIQCAHYMALTDLDRCDVPVLHGGAKFAIYQLHRDLVIERAMIEQLRGWWNDYVLKEVEPPLDASEAWGNYLANKYPHNRGPMLELTDEEHPELLRQVKNVLDLKEVIDHLKVRLELARSTVKAAIGNNDGLVGGFGKITWRRTKDSTARVCNYERLFLHLAREFKLTDDARDELIDQFMETLTTKTGERRFVATRAKDIDHAIPTAEHLLSLVE